MGRHGAAVLLGEPQFTLVGDSWQMTKRLLKQIVRVPDLLIFSLIQPVMFVVLFRYVFGGAIYVTGASPYAAEAAKHYVLYMIPGVFVQTLLFNGTSTGIGMADDMQKGLVDRFRSLPIARSALLIGRSVSDLMRAVLILAVMLGVALLTGFRFSGGLAHAAWGTLLIIAFSYAFSWIGIWMGLVVKSAEAAQSGSFLWLFPLTFASSAFVGTSTMPHWLRVFAEHNPVTVVVNSVRALYLSPNYRRLFATPELRWQLAQSLFWLVVVLVVFIPLSVRRFRGITR